MKTKFVILLSAISALLLSYSCNQKPENQLREELQQSKVFSKAAGCNCDYDYTNPDCPECITQAFMQGKNYLEYEATFTHCTSSDPDDQGCTFDNSKKYKVTFCYAQPTPNAPDDCALYMQIEDAPACIRCITTFPYCVRLKATCTSSNGKDYTVYLDDNDPGTGPVVEYQYSISQDPKFSICCKKPDPNFPGNFLKFCCNGDLVKKI
jgi:hypothetical protein